MIYQSESRQLSSGAAKTKLALSLANGIRDDGAGPTALGDDVYSEAFRK